MRWSLWVSGLADALHMPAQVQHEGPQVQLVCVGSEWHRFPSAFFLPGPSYRLAFLPSGFGGLLPHAFNTSQAKPRLAGLILTSSVPDLSHHVQDVSQLCPATGACKLRLRACEQGGTAAAPPYFNDRNRADSRNVLADASSCSFLAGLAPHGRPLQLLGEPCTAMLVVGVC